MTGNKDTSDAAPKGGADIASEPTRKASLGQVAATMFWAMCMIGKKGTWERNGARITLAQAVVGAIVAGIIVTTLLVLLVRLAVR